jgi:type IV pilus assembly protein PilY1
VDNSTKLLDASIYPVTSDETNFPGCTPSDPSTYYYCEKKTQYQSSSTSLDLSNTSWRTVLIGGMGLGGASSNLGDTCTNCVKTPISNVGYSSYFALDVTDSTDPKMMWEFSNPALGYSTTGPAIVRVGERGKNGRWFAVFASGPTGPIDTAKHQFLGRSDQNLHIFVVDLATGQLLRTISPSADVVPSNAFAGSLASSVIDTDRGNPSSSGFYNDDAVYIGYVAKDTTASGDNVWTKGGVIRLLTNENTNPDNWTVSKVIGDIGPVTSSVTKLQDRTNHKLWIYFGTGRYFFRTAQIH